MAPFESGGFRADHWRSTAPYNRGVSWPVLSFKKDFRKQPLIQSSPAFFTVCAREHSAAAIRPSRISKTESLPSYAGMNFRYSEDGVMNGAAGKQQASKATAGCDFCG